MKEEHRDIPVFFAGVEPAAMAGGHGGCCNTGQAF